MKIWKWIPEIVIVALTLVLRLPGITASPLTLSESRILLFASDTWEHLWKLFLIGADMHSGASIAYLYVIKLIGNSTEVSRYLSLVCGLLSIAVSYSLVKKLFGRGAARVTAFLLTIAPYHVMVSRSIDMVPAGLLIAVLAMLYFLKVYEGETSANVAICFSMVMLIGINFHYYCAILVIPANFLFIGFAKRKKENMTWWIPVNVIIVALCAFWTTRWTGGFFTPSMESTFAGDMTELGVVAPENFFNIQFHLLFLEKYIRILYALGGFFGSAKLLNGWSTLGVILIPIVFHYLPFMGFREYEDGYRSRLFAFVFLACMIGAASLLSFTAVPIWDYILIISVIFYAVCANGAARFSTMRTRAALAVMVLCILAGFVPTQKLNESSRADWEKISKVMNDPVNLNQGLIFLDGGLSPPVLLLAPELRSRMFVLMKNFDLGLLEDGKYRQEEVLPLFNARIDSYPPNELVEIMATIREAWVVVDTDPERYENKHVHEYEMWLKGYAHEMEAIDLGGYIYLKRYVLKVNPDRNPLDIK